MDKDTVKVKVEGGFEEAAADDEGGIKKGNEVE